MALVLAVSTSQGKRAGINTATGIAAARTLHVVGSGLGLAVLFANYPYLQSNVRVTGAAYLLYWAWKIMQTPLIQCKTVTTLSLTANDIKRGFLTNLLNPKAVFFCSMLLPQFTSPSQGTLLSQFLLLGSVLVSVGFLFDTSYVFLADGLIKRLGNKMNDGTRFSLHVEKGRNWLLIVVLSGVAAHLLLN